MSRLSRSLRKAVAILIGAALLWNVGIEPCSDWIEHEQSHTVASAFDAGDEDDHPPARTPSAQHDKCGHACHHLQVHLARSRPVRLALTVLPKPASSAIACYECAPDLPYRPPRSPALA